jgi:poly(ADP-ribose) glycohydrolase ARH3
MHPKKGGDGQYRVVGDRFKGSTLGTFVGDALGRQIEGWSSQMIQATHGLLVEMGQGIYTDDTEMMIGILESLVECPQFDPALTSGKFLINFNPSRGYGGRIYGVMDRLRSGVAWNESGTDSWGNGGAMRIAPIGAFFYDNPARLEEAARDCTWITHHHPLGLAGALAQARAVGLATLKGIRGEVIQKAEFIDTVMGTVAPTSEEMARAIAKIQDMDRGTDMRETISRIVSRFACDVSALGAVPPALASFLLTGSFRESVVVAVNCGGDTDTIGAMTGAIAGAYYGYDEIPREWVVGLENGPKGRDYVLSLAERLAEMKNQSLTAEATSAE